MNTKSENNVLEILEKFDPITLKEMDAVRLMRRIDSKYVFGVDKLPLLLQMAAEDYFMVEIEGFREQIYETTYYDTPGYTMFHCHQNGKLNRHKIRIRKYIYSKQEFLEVKAKTNKGETIKTRIGNNGADSSIDDTRNSVFLEKYTPYNPAELKPVLGNNFIRLTLVSKSLKERITLDYNINFTDLGSNKQCSPKGICIAEVKRNRDDRKSTFMQLIGKLRISSMGFSKYAIGMAMLNTEVKTNLFKAKIRAIEKCIMIQN